MEPVAPGTEDDPQIAYSTLNKQENEQERLLSIKSVLPNGQYGNVFELSYVNGSAHWFCNACKCPVMGRVYQHEIGRRHTINIALGTKQQPKTPLGGIEQPISVAPGEPVPPGFENDVAREAQIQERLDGFKVGPLVALEYLLELQDYDAQKEPSYLCILCDKRGDPRTVLTHLASYNHISQYLQKHFPTCYRALAPYMTKQYKRNWQTTLQKLAEAIEKRFGRMKPLPVQNHRFEMDRMLYLEMVVKGRHFSEQTGPTFEELIVHEELTKVYDDEKFDFKDFKPLSLTQPSKSTHKRSPSPPVVARPKKNKAGGSKKAVSQRRRSLSSISSASSSDLSEYEADTRRKKYKGRSPTRYYHRSPSPRRRYDDYSRKEEAERHQKERAIKVEEFKRLGKALENDMQNVLKNHEKNPEKHPKYNDEWKKFWNKRYKELQGDGVDVAKYDFKPDWIKFWNKRMVELHQDEVKQKKEALRRRLGLPDEPAPISFRIGAPSKFRPEPTKSGAPKPLPMAAQPDQDNEVIIIEDKDDDVKVSGKQRSHSPWESDNSTPLKRRSRSYSRSVSKERSSSSRYRSPGSPRRHSRRISRSRSRERYAERLPPREYRESSYERDLRAKERVRVVSELPWKREKVYRGEYEEYYKPPHVMRSVTRKPIHPIAPTIPPEDDENIDVNVVSVLRLLTALEERLGSLGPKVIDLLAQALALEKNEANSADNLLDSEINCMLFETVKEKLKGQLLAGFVDVIQERAFKIAIKKTANLLHIAGGRQKEKVPPKVDPVKVPGIGTVDKVAIAKQIANALVQQGKTDVTQTELEQLINAVIGMAEASKNSSKPITTAAFLEKFGLGDGNAAAAAGETSATKVVEEVKEASLEPLTPSPEKPPVINSMDHLSESDLQTLLQNFKDLSTDEQHGLINYLKKLEAHEPERVERLRKFVNLGSSAAKTEEPVKSGRESPFSHRLGGQNPEADEDVVEVDKKTKVDTKEEKINLDSDEEDYTFDDVVQAVNVKEKERNDVESFEAKKMDVDLSDAKALISNLMSNINKSTPSASSSLNLLGLGTCPVTTAAELTKTLNTLPINMDNLANIVGNVQKLTQQEKQPIRITFPSQQKQQPFVGNVRFEPPSGNLQGIAGPDRSIGNLEQSSNLQGIVGPERNSGGIYPRQMVQYPQKNMQFNNSYQQLPQQQQQQQGFQQFSRPPNSSNFGANQYNRPGGNNYNRW